MSEKELERLGLDIEETPFSYQGSWLDVSSIVGVHKHSQDLCLVSHQTGMHPVLRLVPRAPGTGNRVMAERSMTPSLLRLVGGEGDVELCFADTSTLRLRGRGLALSLTATKEHLSPFSGTYLFVDPLDNAAVFTSYETGRRYRVTCLAGKMSVSGAEQLGGCQREVEVGKDGEPWEIAIEEFDAARTPYAPEASFDELEERCDALFSAYAQKLVPWSPCPPLAARKAAYVLWSATVKPRGFVQREAVLMSKHWMDKVWSWDHCFNALAMARSDPERALHQFLLPFDHQDLSGALPDSVTHSELLYNFTKPPVHGWTFRKLRQLMPGELGRDQLADVYDKLAGLTRFWLDLRVARGRSLPYYQHGNDSGWDNATMFDRGRVVEAPDLAAFLIVQLEVLSGLAPEVGRQHEQAQWDECRARLSHALVRHLWVDDAFVARSPVTDEPSSATSLLGAIPIVACDALSPSIVKALARKLSVHLTDWGLATELLSSPEYEPDGYWRGPVWAPATVLAEDGLRRAGYEQLADEVSHRFRRLCEVSGFAENFDASTGRGLRDRSYTWTASCYLLLSAEHAARGDTVRQSAPAEQEGSASAEALTCVLADSTDQGR